MACHCLQEPTLPAHRRSASKGDSVLPDPGSSLRFGQPKFTYTLHAGLAMAENNLEIVRGMYEAFARGDVPAVLGAMSEDIVWNEAEGFPYADRNPYTGPQAVVEGVFTRLGTEWDGWTLDVRDYVAGGNSVVAMGRYRAIYKANGKSLDAQFAHVWKLQEGKAVSFQQYTDTAQAQAVVRDD